MGYYLTDKEKEFLVSTFPDGDTRDMMQLLVELSVEQQAGMYNATHRMVEIAGERRKKNAH